MLRMEKIYENIKKLRLKKGYSQSKLAELVGYKDKTMISKIELGKVDLPQSKAEEFARVFGVTPMQLLGWDKIEDVADTASSIINRQDELNDAFHDIRKKYDNSDDAGKNEIMTVLNLLRT